MAAVCLQATGSRCRQTVAGYRRPCKLVNASGVPGSWITELVFDSDIEKEELGSAVFVRKVLGVQSKGT